MPFCRHPFASGSFLIRAYCESPATATRSHFAHALDLKRDKFIPLQDIQAEKSKAQNSRLKKTSGAKDPTGEARRFLRSGPASELRPPFWSLILGAALRL
jgi:hypothetical protein